MDLFMVSHEYTLRAFERKRAALLRVHFQSVMDELERTDCTFREMKIRSEACPEYSLQCPPFYQFFCDRLPDRINNRIVQYRGRGIESERTNQ
jgi:hypothetical protein